MAGGRGRGRSRGTPSDPSPSGGVGASLPSPSPSASAPSTAPSTVSGRRACEACEAAPGMPFCRVEWSFLCSSCGPALHRNSWIVAVPPFPGPTPTGTSITDTGTGTGTDPSQSLPPYYFPPFMQMPPVPPMHTPYQMPIPMHPPNPNTTAMAGKKRRGRPRVMLPSKEQMPAVAPAAAADTDSDPDPLQDESKRVVRHGMKHNTKSPPPPLTRTDTGNAYAELNPGVEDAMITNMPESAQVDAIENLAAEMEPPPTELDEIEQVIEEQEEQ